ncbi:MarR family transcriptional regulator, transcriptional regulator for hemolysin [Arboricoccus pini]|uniref:MarR family transcriptional regulator, transcriptional regulator for hemolysin n=1 Tax=Arboricoccus pini TaxID=1963835 RepID=A0A212REU3_9PROT|nr:MarR family transcriptional regulator [Arboricoccus pini]SNB70884.1 MarR family transcriptional regulator, transcriptional regulator for hemolysin [Arboricoccus pini]
MNKFLAVMDREKAGHPDITVTYRTMRLAALWRTHLDRAYAETGLSLTLVRPLLYLALMPEGLSQRNLVDALQCDDATLARIVDTLEKQGFIERKVDMKDRRLKRVTLTALGIDRIGPIFAITQQIEETVLSGLSQKQREELISSLDKIISNFLLEP